MWSKLPDGLDGVDDHTQIASRAAEATRKTTRINMILYYNECWGGGGGYQLE